MTLGTANVPLTDDIHFTVILQTSGSAVLADVTKMERCHVIYEP